MKRKRLSIALALLAGLSGLSCSTLANSRGAPSDASVLRVGLAPDQPPMAFWRGARLEGIEPDLARQAARELGRRLEIVVMEPSALVPALERGELDVIMSGLRIGPAGRDTVLFTQPYLRAGQRMLIRRKDLDRLGLPGAVQHAGARVGYVYASPGAEYVRAQFDPYERELYGFASTAAAIRSLKAERIDFFIHDAPALWWLMIGPEGSGLVVLQTPLTEVDLAWAVAQNNLQLKRRLDQLIDRWRATDTLGRVIERWIPVRLDPDGPASSSPGAKADRPNGG